MKNDNAPARSGRETRGERRAARRQRIFLWCAALVVLLLLAVSARPVYRWLKAQRADRFAAEADALTREGKINEAVAKYRAALQLAPHGYRPLSGAARLATRAGRPEAIDLWQAVMALPKCTTEDRQDFATLLLRLGAMRAAGKLVDDLLKADPNARTLSLAAQYYSRDGNETKALESARLAVACAPDDDATRFQLAEMLAKSTDAALRAEARQILWLLAGKQGRVQKAAVEALARAPELSSEEEQKVLAAIDALPERNAVSGLLGSELKLKLQPDNAEKIYDEALAAWGNSEPAKVAELARWLNLHKQSERVLTLLPVERAVSSEPLLLSRLDALADLSRWKEIDGLLAQPELHLDPAVTESFRARTSIGQGATMDADLHWDRAIALAANEPHKLRFIANFAEQSRATPAALKAYDQLSRFSEHAAFAQRGRQRLIEQSGDALAARNVAERLSTIAPEDVNAQAQLIHLNLLLDQEVETNLEKAKALVAKYPTRLSFRVAAALGFLRQHDAASALAQFQGPVPIEWPRTPPGWRAVYAAALAANDQAEAAQGIVATIPLDRLNKEERELIAPIHAAP